MKFSVTKVITLVIFSYDGCLIKRKEGEIYTTNPQEQATFFTHFFETSNSLRNFKLKKSVNIHIITIIRLLCTTVYHFRQLNTKCIKFIAYVYPEPFHFILTNVNFMNRDNGKMIRKYDFSNLYTISYLHL